MPIKANKILKNNHWEKSLKPQSIIYADIECSLIKQQSCQNNQNKSYTERKIMHELSGYTLSLISSFELIKENK